MPTSCNSQVNLPWKVGRIILTVFRAARVARTWTARFVPVAGRRVLDLKGWLLPYNRVCRGKSRFGGVVDTGHKTSLKANDAPFGVSAAKEGGVAEFASGGRYAVGCW